MHNTETRLAGPAENYIGCSGLHNYGLNSVELSSGILPLPTDPIGRVFVRGPIRRTSGLLPVGTGHHLLWPAVSGHSCQRTRSGTWRMSSSMGESGREGGSASVRSRRRSSRTCVTSVTLRTFVKRGEFSTNSYGRPTT